MGQAARHATVRIIRRPAPRRKKEPRIALWSLLAVLGIFAGVFAVSASGRLPLPTEQRNIELPERTITRGAQRITVPRSAVPTLVPLPANRQQAAPPAEVPTLATVAAVAESSSLPQPSSALLSGLRHEYQGWNNCAPSSVGMVLSFYGRTEAQAEIAPILKPDPNDKNVSPHEIAAYAEALGFHAHVGVGGDLSLLKRLLVAGFPVMVEFWFEPEPDDGMGHYRVLFGFDDRSQTLSALDSYLGPSVTVGYAQFDTTWHVFNRTYIVIYPQEAQTTVAAILDESTKGTQMWQRAFRTALAELSQDRNDAFAWFNLGTSALQLGDTRQAAEAFDWARQLGLPWRMFWYQFGPFEAYLAQGRYQDVIALAESGMKDTDVEEWYFWRGRAREMTGDQEGARRDYISALSLNANYSAAKKALAAIQAA